MRANSTVKSRVSRFASALGAFVLAFGVFALGTPAHADVVNAEMPFKISGNVQNKGVGIPGVSISMTGPAGFAATVLTDAEGKYVVGVPEKLTDYTVTVDELTLPDGVTVIDNPATEFVEANVQTVTVGPGGRTTMNFFIGQGERKTTSIFDQVVQRLISGINFGLMLALASVGLSLIYGTTGISNFAHAELVTFGAVATYGLVALMGADLLWLAIILALVLSAAVGWGQDAALWAPLRRRGMGLVQLMIVSIGLSLGIRYLYQFFIGGTTEQLPGSDGERFALFGSVTLSATDIASMAISVLLIVLFALWLNRSKVGKATRAISDNPSLAASSGIDVDGVVRIVWIIGSVLAGFSGILWAYFRPGIRWDMGGQILLLIFAATTLGGLGTAYGALVGSLIVGILVEASSLVIPSDLKYVGALVVLIGILLFRPQGILGRKERVG
jgi:branched-chain amino acid transport system permease protein